MVVVGSETDARDYIDFIVTALCDSCKAHTVRIYTYHTRREREKEPRLLTALQMDKVIDTGAPSASSPAPTHDSAHAISSCASARQSILSQRIRLMK